MKQPAVLGHLPLSELRELHRHWGLFVALGLLLVLLGGLTIVASGVSTLMSVVFLGWVMAAGGIAVAIHAFSVTRWSGFFLQLLSGLLYLIVGWLLIIRPGVGAITLTLVLAISLIVQGLFRTATALSTPTDGRGALLLSGVITVALGVMIWNEWPISGTWVLGLFVGVDLVFYGGWIASLGLSLRRLPRAA